MFKCDPTCFSIMNFKSKPTTALIGILMILLLGSVAWGKTVGISNPTIRNLERFVYLADQGILNVDDLKIIGVFHENQTSLIQRSREFAQQHGDAHISFVILKGEPEPQKLFSKNQWSSQFETLFESTDGFIFNGGPDIPPFLYDEETLLGTGIMGKERLWELSLIAHLLGSSRDQSLVPLMNSREDYVVFGICLGMQEMNVATGGSMYQDIPLQLYGIQTYEAYHRLDSNLRHRNDLSKMGYLEDDVMGLQFHPLLLTKGSFLAKLTSEDSASSVVVPSVHHQALKEIAPEFEVVATSIDGKVAEAIQHRVYPNVCGIQFHPEISELYDHEAIKIGNGIFFKIDPANEAFYRSIWAYLSDCLQKQN